MCHTWDALRLYEINNSNLCPQYTVWGPILKSVIIFNLFFYLIIVGSHHGKFLWEELGYRLLELQSQINTDWWLAASQNIATLYLVPLQNNEISDVSMALAKNRCYMPCNTSDPGPPGSGNVISVFSIAGVTAYTTSLFMEKYKYPPFTNKILRVGFELHKCSYVYYSISLL